MSLLESQHFLLWAELRRDKVPSFDSYPFNLPAVRNLEQIAFHPSVTFIVGENGSGKSTLLEAVAVAWGFNAEGGSKNFQFETRASHSELHSFLRLARGLRRPKDGYFMRAESFYNLATQVEDLGVTGYGDASLHEQSHGESFWSLFMERFRGAGFYILDEPEAALSPSRQMSMLVRLHDLVRTRSQFIIATHSPILMAYPDATIYHFTTDGIAPIEYEETEHYKVTRAFLTRTKQMLDELLSE